MRYLHATAIRGASLRLAALVVFFFAFWTLPQGATGQTKTSPAMKIGVIGSGRRICNR
jgi:hypothetical protein